MAEPVSFKPLASGSQSGIVRPRDVVVRTPAEWKTLCTDHVPGQPCPSVDFSRSTVVGVFLGTRPTAGTRIESPASSVRDSLVVTYRERSPGPDEMVAQMLTMPISSSRSIGSLARLRFLRAR